MKKLLILTAALVLAGTTQVFAQEENAVTEKQPCPIQHCEKRGPEAGCPAKMHRPPCDMKKFEDELNLTDKQKEQAKQLREKQMEAAKPLIEQLKVKEQEKQEIKSQLRALREQGKKDFEAILTDKQIKKLETLKSERKQEFGKKHHRDDMHRRPPMPPECKCGKVPAPAEPIEE